MAAEEKVIAKMKATMAAEEEAWEPPTSALAQWTDVLSPGFQFDQFDILRPVDVVEAERSQKDEVERSLRAKRFQQDPNRSGGPSIQQSGELREVLDELRRRFNLKEGDPEKISSTDLTKAFAHATTVHRTEKLAEADDIAAYHLAVEQYIDQTGLGPHDPGFSPELLQEGFDLGRLDDARGIYANHPAAANAQAQSKAAIANHQLAKMSEAMNDFDTGVFENLTKQQLVVRYKPYLSVADWSKVWAMHDKARGATSNGPPGVSKSDWGMALRKGWLHDQLVHNMVVAKVIPRRKKEDKIDPINQPMYAYQFAAYEREVVKRLRQEDKWRVENKRPSLTRLEVENIGKDVAQDIVLAAPAGAGWWQWWESADPVPVFKPYLDEDQPHFDPETIKVMVGGKTVTLGEMQQWGQRDTTDKWLLKRVMDSTGGYRWKPEKQKQVKDEIDAIKASTHNPSKQNLLIEEVWDREGVIDRPTMRERAETHLELLRRKVKKAPVSYDPPIARPRRQAPVRTYGASGK
jgi:hypothetical protein